MTLSVVSSNEDAQQQPSSNGSTMAETTSSTKDATTTRRSSQDSGFGSQPALCPVKYLGQNLRITACANQGGRKYMEDRVHVKVQRDEASGAIDWTYVAVYDGHGGPEASEYCRRHLLKNIQAEKGFNSEDDQEFLDAIRNGFLKTHHTMWKQVDTWAPTASGYPSTAGTTASCAFIRRNKVYVGHVGDSAIILTTREPDTFYRLTEDHKPECPAEKRRIEASGGQVAQKQNVYRVVWTRANNTHVGSIRRNTPTQTIPFLAVARSLGDFWSYIESSQEFAVSPIPDVSVTELKPEHHSLVLASDGLTNVVSADLEAAMMYELAQEEHQKFYFKNQNEQPNHARILMRRTMKNWRRFRADNVSILTVVFGDFPEPAPARAATPTRGISVEDEQALFGVESTICAPVEMEKEADVDATLSEHPLAMMHVTNEKVWRYATAPVALEYNGHFDSNFSSVPTTIGPGFVTHESEGEHAVASAGNSMVERARAQRLEQYYDMLGRGERDVTPENRPPPTSTANLTNTTTTTVVTSSSSSTTIATCSTGAVDTAVVVEKKVTSSIVQTADGEGAAEERPSTPENKPDALFAVLRNSRSAGKRKSRLLLEDEDENDKSDFLDDQPSTSRALTRRSMVGEEGEEDEEHNAAADESILMEDSEMEGVADDDEHEAVLKMALPFAGRDDEDDVIDVEGGVGLAREELAMRTPSPIGDVVEGDQVVPATPLCNTVATEREVERRVTRSVAATTTSCSVKEMIVMERPATGRRSAARRLLLDNEKDAAHAGPASSLPRTPRFVFELDDPVHPTIASRTRSRDGQITPPPGASATPGSTAVSGSRKRPRTQMDSGTSTATPLLSKISFAEMNENADSSMESDEVSGASPKAAAGTSSKWKRANRKPLGSATR